MESCSWFSLQSGNLGKQEILHSSSSLVIAEGESMCLCVCRRLTCICEGTLDRMHLCRNLCEPEL